MGGGLLSQLKYPIFFLFILTAVPVGTILSKKYRSVEKAIFFLTIFFTCKEVTVNFVSRETFRLTTRGFEIGMVDCLVIILLMVTLSRNRGTQKPKGAILFIMYLFFSVISIVNSESYLFSFFEVSKMLRMYFFLWVLYNYIDSEEKIIDMMKYISIIIIYIFLTVLKQKYVDGYFQTPGPFPHQNSLVMYMIIFNSLVLSYLLNYKNSNFFYWSMVFGMGAVVIVSTLSRAGMAVFAMSCFIIFSLSIFNRFSFRKIVVLVFAMIVGTVVLAKAMDSIMERFETAPEESKQVRVLLAQAAVKMANDKVLGVGLNNFGIKINPPYKYGNHIEHKGDGDVKNGLVETVYLMVAAETGWHNLFIFILWLLTMYYYNVRNFFIYRKTKMVFVPVGLMGALAAIYAESTLEWVLKQTHNFFQLMLIFAIIGTMYRKRIMNEKT